MEKPKVIRRKNLHTISKNSIEKRYWAQDLLVCGIDEAGRGPLAGPVVAAAAVVPKDCKYKLLKDSKILTEEERIKAFHWIIKHCWYGFSIENHVTIDRYNIYQTTLRAMQRAFSQAVSTCTAPIGGVAVDAMPLTFKTKSYSALPVHAFIEAESLSMSVAAASIVAKVVRDALMEKLDPALPGYLFAKHKGYATPEHKALIDFYGRSLVHRTSFLTTLEKNKEDNGNATQTTIWGSDSQHP